MIGFIANAPGWMLAHPWALTAWAIGTMALSVPAMMLNPRGRQLREILRRKK